MDSPLAAPVEIPPWRPKAGERVAPRRGVNPPHPRPQLREADGWRRQPRETHPAPPKPVPTPFGLQ